jgi:hypothetical protein
MQALLALTLSSAGRPTVAVGARQVPPPAFANAIAELAAEAASDDAYYEVDEPTHLFDEAGDPRGDLANPAERAAILLADLAAVAAEEAAADVDEADDGRYGDAWDEALDESWDDGLDPLDAYDDAVEGRSRV